MLGAATVRIAAPAVLSYALYRQSLNDARESAMGLSRKLSLAHSHTAKALQARSMSIVERMGGHVAVADTRERTPLTRALERLEGKAPGADSGKDAQEKPLRWPSVRGIRTWAVEDGCTVFEATVQAPIKEVSTAVWHADARQHWDERISAGQLVRPPALEQDADHLRCVYLRRSRREAFGWRGALLSDRDECFTLCRIPAAALGRGSKEPFSSELYVFVDSSDAVSREPRCIRGRTNGLILLRQAGGGTTTKVLLVKEQDPAGWGWLSVLGLGLPRHKVAQEDVEVLKDFVEEVMEEAVVDPKAYKRLNGELADSAAGSSMVDAVGVHVTRAELLAMRDTLQRKLKKIRADERAEGLDLASLKRQVARDLKKVDARLRFAK